MNAEYIRLALIVGILLLAGLCFAWSNGLVQRSIVLETDPDGDGKARLIYVKIWAAGAFALVGAGLVWTAVSSGTGGTIKPVASQADVQHQPAVTAASPVVRRQAP